MSENCLTTEQIERFRAKKLSPSELLAVGDHLAICVDCRVLLSSTKPAGAPGRLPAIGGFASPRRLKHPSARALTRYIGGEMRSANRLDLQDHVDICDLCRSRIENLRSLRDSGSLAAQRPWPFAIVSQGRAPAYAMAAAFVAFAIGLGGVAHFETALKTTPASAPIAGAKLAPPPAQSAAEPAPGIRIASAPHEGPVAAATLGERKVSNRVALPPVVSARSKLPAMASTTVAVEPVPSQLDAGAGEKHAAPMQFASAAHSSPGIQESLGETSNLPAEAPSPSASRPPVFAPKNGDTFAATSAQRMAAKSGAPAAAVPAQIASAGIVGAGAPEPSVPSSDRVFGGSTSANLKPAAPSGPRREINMASNGAFKAQSIQPGAFANPTAPSPNGAHQSYAFAGRALTESAPVARTPAFGANAHSDVSSSPVAGSRIANGIAESVTNWKALPKFQSVDIQRAMFDAEGFRLRDMSGRTIAVPLKGNGETVLRFALSSDGEAHFVVDGGTPILSIAQDGYVENASASGARWYPFSSSFHPFGPIAICPAPSWSAFVGMRWYPGMTVRGGYWAGNPHSGEGALHRAPGLVYAIGNARYYGWLSYRAHVEGRPATPSLKSK